MYRYLIEPKWVSVNGWWCNDQVTSWSERASVGLHTNETKIFKPGRGDILLGKSKIIARFQKRTYDVPTLGRLGASYRRLARFYL